MEEDDAWRRTRHGRHGGGQDMEEDDAWKATYQP
jgi:hypothetical protein